MPGLPRDEPATALRQALDAAGIDPARFLAIEPGGTLDVAAMRPTAEPLGAG
ncbi:hypothetical protein [Jiella flava]|uniref:Uncharacterized protein n=1 Tax=Jiella flava TaxID=2816857 RepID=A0A939G1U8_9HYPH|nr:hypothetical protein [Jiella flava]MBO0664256.1 hypothetical protein [Jiella flava]